MPRNNKRSRRSPSQPADQSSERTAEVTAKTPSDLVGTALWPPAWNIIFCTLLLTAIAYAFSPVVLGHDIEFIHFDDDRYVFGNAMVVQGLTPETVHWAFRSKSYDNWHPLTWLSHLLDVSLFGIVGSDAAHHPISSAWAHHRTSIVLHGLASLGLFIALMRLTQASWPSALTTLLFAVHPLRAESVAWIAERKDTLSGLFFVLTLLAYGEYSRRWHAKQPFSPANLTWAFGWYMLTIVFYGMGLMSKPMLVSMPFLLLLLDYWPLSRVEGGAWRVKRDEKGLGLNSSLPPTQNPSPSTLHPSPFLLLLEKLPLFIMAGASCLVTIDAQQGAMKVIENITPGLRTENAIFSYAAYIGQLFVPVGLTALYPYPEHGIPAYKVAIAGICLVAISIGVFFARRHRYLVVGCLWYLIALLPVIGIVQVGVQGMADRYTYLPHIGLGIMLAWLLWELTAHLPLRDVVWVSIVGLLAVVLAEATRQQVGTWKNDETFFGHALEVDPNIAMAHNNVGWLREQEGKLDDAESHYRRALEIRPRYVEPHINLANILLKQGKPAEAVRYLTEATQIRPDYDQGFLNLGKALALNHQRAEAIEAFRTAVKLSPDYVEAHYNLGVTLLEAGQIDEGVRELNEVLRIDSNNMLALDLLGRVYMQTRKPELAIACFRKSIANKVQAPPASALAGLAYLQYKNGKPADAIITWRRLLQAQPKSVTAHVMLAWTLATSDDNTVRDGAEARRLAQQAIEIVGNRNPQALIALSAALAETGQFDEAIKVVHQAMDAAQSAHASDLTKIAAIPEPSFKAHLAYRDHDASVFFSLGDILAAK